MKSTSYVIRSKKNNKAFVFYHEKKYILFQPDDGTPNGACVFTYEQAQRFLSDQKSTDLYMDPFGNKN